MDRYGNNLLFRDNIKSLTNKMPTKRGEASSNKMSGTESLKHVLDNVMLLRKDHSLCLCLDYENINNIDDVISLQEKQIEVMKYIDKNGNISPITLYCKGRLHTF